MKVFLFFLFMALLPFGLKAQGENNIWTLGSTTFGFQSDIIDFGSNPPVVITWPFSHGTYVVPVCRPNGQLRFFVNFGILSAGESTTPKFFTPNGQPITGSQLNLGPAATEKYFPAVIPHPGNGDQYYIFYANANALLYSLLDMSLNNGTGGIVPGQKDIFLSAYGTVYPDAMTTVKGCNGVWLVARSRTDNQYFSYHVTGNGLDTNKVVSECGTFPINEVCSYRYGTLISSPNGKHLAFVGIRKGIELYDFEKCSGKVKNARVIDTVNTPCFYSNTLENHWFESACFSPDESKLYATRNMMLAPHPPQTVQPFGNLPGKLFQYDLSQPTLASVIASKTLILTSLPSIKEDLSGCGNLYNNNLGDLKLAPNNKIYFDNGSYTPGCAISLPPPPGQNLAAFHCINQPNLQGLACLVSLYEIVTPGIGYASNNFDAAGSYLSQNIITAPPAPDTINGNVSNLFACFKDSLTLLADSTGSCYIWDDGATERQRTVSRSGIYHVRYFKDCHIITDTFHLSLISLPTLVTASEDCPGMHMGSHSASAASNNFCPLRYVWKTTDSSIIRSHIGTHGDTITGLEAGKYLLQVSTPLGCDTTIIAEITSLPKPNVSASPSNATIPYGDSIMLHADGALLYVWLPSGLMDTATKANPIAKPLKPTIFSVIGINQYGCRDTGYVSIDIDYHIPDLIPNAFSPNGDGINDVFRIEAITYQKVVQFKIFNRYGQCVYAAPDNKGWDGFQNDKPCDIGTYYYLIGIEYPDGRKKILKGDLLLFR